MPPAGQNGTKVGVVGVEGVVKVVGVVGGWVSWKKLTVTQKKVEKKNVQLVQPGW